MSGYAGLNMLPWPAPDKETGGLSGEIVLDARGLSCPLPVLKARKWLQAMAPGERLRVLATDPKAPADFRLYCSESEHRLIEEAAEGEGFVLLLERGA